MARARTGSYTQYEVQRGLSVHRLLQYFTRQGEQWIASRQLRAMCSFREWNLLDDPAPLGKFDIVFCRNVLFYFDLATKAKVLASIRRQMVPDGLALPRVCRNYDGAGRRARTGWAEPRASGERAPGCNRPEGFDATAPHPNVPVVAINGRVTMTGDE